MGHAVGIALGMWVASAHAETDPCAQTLDVARQLRNAGQIHQALQELGDCSRCEAAREVCDATRISLRSAMPTVLVAVHDSDGRQIDDVKVSVDEAPAQQNRTVELDPGSHRIRVEGIGRATSERTVNLGEHDSLRLELVLAPAPALPPKPLTTRPIPASVWAVGGSALAAVVASTVLWAVAWHDQTEATNALQSPQYSSAYRLDLYNAKISDEQRLLIAGDIACAVGVAGLVTTLVLYLVRPARTVTVGAAALSLRF